MLCKKEFEWFFPVCMREELLWTVRATISRNGKQRALLNKS